MATPNVGGDIPFTIKYRPEIDGEMIHKNGNTGEVITAAEAEALHNMGGTPEPVGDTVPKRTPQAGEQVKIVAKDARGKGGSAHYYVTDELGNQYEVDKKTYNSIKKGKGFVDGGQLRPIAEGAPQPIKKPVDVQKGEQSQARREVQRAATEAESAVKSQTTLTEQKEALKQEYKAAQKEMKEARKALVEAIEKPGSDIKGASDRYTTARSKFKNISREYKSLLTNLKNAIGRTERAVTTLEHAKTRSKAVTKARDAAKAAERKAAAEAEAARQARHDAKVVKPTGGNVPPSQPNEPKVPKVQPEPNPPTEATPMGDKAIKNKGLPEGPRVTGTEGAVNAVEEVGETVTKTENTASKALTTTEEAASKVKGGGKWGKIIGGVLVAVAAIGLTTLAYVNNKSDDKVDETKSDDEVKENGTTVTEEETITETEETTTEGDTAAGAVSEAEEGAAEEVTTNNTTKEEVAAAQAANDQDLAEVEADDADFSKPITVSEGDNLWNICKQDLRDKNGGKEPTNKEILEAVQKVMAKNSDSLKFESDGYRVLIYVDDTFDQDGTYHRNR